MAKNANTKPRRLRKWMIVAVVTIIIIVIGITRSKKNAKGVETATVQKGLIKEELILSGEIVADEHAKLTFATGGKVSYVGVKEGDVVAKGKLLTKLDTSNLNSDFERARADLRSAEASVQKVHDDLKDAGSAETFEEKETRTTAETAKDKAYEAYLKALENLKGASLFAPFGGTVTYVANTFSGLNVLSTQTQIEMVNPETIYFEVSADQSEVIKLFEEQEVSIILDSFLEKEFSGTISAISLTPKEGEAGTVYKVRVVFDDSALDNIDFRIGMTGDARFQIKEKHDALYLPSKFVNSDKDGDFIYKKPKGDKLYIEVGLQGEDITEILGDVEEGDHVFD